jgi:hypothetical protein
LILYVKKLKFIVYSHLKVDKMANFTQTFTLTFGDQGENHVGMQKIGKMASRGYKLEDLLKAKEFFEEKFIQVEIFHLNKLLPKGTTKDVDNAYVLVARNGVKVWQDPDLLYEEQDGLEKDTKANMYGRVVNKKARYNLCFAKEAQEPDYEDKKGRIVSFRDVPFLKDIKKKIERLMNDENLIIEGNYYYDTKKCYIGFHGDSERRKVIGLRLGKSFKFHYQWYGASEYDEEETLKARKKNKNAKDRKTKRKLGTRLEILLGHGDLYIMSEKAVGTDWKHPGTITLRHAAGEAKDIDLNPEFTKGGEIMYGNEKEYLVDDDGFVEIEILWK